MYKCSTTTMTSTTTTRTNLCHYKVLRHGQHANETNYRKDCLKNMFRYLLTSLHILAHLMHASNFDIYFVFQG